MKIAKLCRGTVVVIILVFIFCSTVFAETDPISFAIGEKIRYSIYAAGWRVGYQTIELDSIQKLNDVDVYLLKGLSKTAVFVSIFYRLNDKWSVFIDKNSLCHFGWKRTGRRERAKGIIYMKSISKIAS